MQSDSIPVHNLYALRTKRGLSCAQVAAACGVHEGTYGHWERGNFNPRTMDKVRRLARVLHAPAWRLMQKEAL